MKLAILQKVAPQHDRQDAVIITKRRNTKHESTFINHFSYYVPIVAAPETVT